jgi:hypothetical protein
VEHHPTLRLFLRKLEEAMRDNEDYDLNIFAEKHVVRVWADFMVQYNLINADTTRDEYRKYSVRLSSSSNSLSGSKGKADKSSKDKSNSSKKRDPSHIATRPGELPQCKVCGHNHKHLNNPKDCTLWEHRDSNKSDADFTNSEKGRLWAKRKEEGHIKYANVDPFHDLKGNAITAPAIYMTARAEKATRDAKKAKKGTLFVDESISHSNTACTCGQQIAGDAPTSCSCETRAGNISIPYSI